jgi:hypothetical protein
MSGKLARVRSARADPPTDPRSSRFAAGVTVAVVLAVLITSNAALFAAQAVVYALGALLGLRYAPYQALYRFVARGAQLAPSDQSRSPEPYRFAQRTGLVFALAGTIGYLIGFDPVGPVAAGVLLLGGLVNAATGFCVCAEFYQLITRLAQRPSTP